MKYLLHVIFIATGLFSYSNLFCMKNSLEGTLQQCIPMVTISDELNRINSEGNTLVEEFKNLHQELFARSKKSEQRKIILSLWAALCDIWEIESINKFYASDIIKSLLQDNRFNKVMLSLKTKKKIQDIFIGNMAGNSIQDMSLEDFCVMMQKSINEYHKNLKKIFSDHLEAW